MAPPPGLLLFAALIGAVGSISISTISATNESSVILPTPDNLCLQDEPACSCAQMAIMKCFCPNDTYLLHFGFNRLTTPLDLLQIGVCRQLTLYGQAFSDQPPEFIQIFDTDNIFLDRTSSLETFPTSAMTTPPTSPAMSTSYPDATTRPIRRIEFLNVTIAYLALSDLYALNRVEQFIIQNSTVLVLGGRPSEDGPVSNIGSIQLLSSKFMEVRRSALDIVGLDAFLMTNSTVHQWHAGAVRLMTNEGATVVVSDCGVDRAEPAALRLLASGNAAALRIQGNHFGHVADDAFRLVDGGRVDVRFAGNHVDDPRPRAMLGLLMDVGSIDFSGNVLPCDRQLCFGGHSQALVGNQCFTRGNDSRVDAAVPFDLEAAALPLMDDACRVPADDELLPLMQGRGSRCQFSLLIVVTAVALRAMV